ncbi:MAG: xanthine dehydrogenase family protein subunit M [Chloroflexi bacterium]|nr:xanthine dehydrogenase family protein subunit M [Chloroflexota bacterium]
MKPFEYHAPVSLADAVVLLKRSNGALRPLAGGTDLIAQMKAGRRESAVVLNVKRIAECKTLAFEKDGLHIGAAVTCTAIAGNPKVASAYPVLVQGCRLIGSVQIQNRASMGGNICNAAPSADTIPGAICLGARVRIAGPRGRRELPLEEFFSGPGKTVLASDEILVDIVVPPPAPHSASAYERFTPRAEMDIAFAGVASYLRLDSKSGRCAEARICLGAVAPTPLRASQAERALVGQAVTKDTIREAARRAAMDAQPITDQRASADYRRELVQVLTRHTLAQCAKDVGMAL